MSFLTRFSERVGSRRRLSLVSIVGIVLVPFVIAGVLVWALWNPQDRLDTMQAAIVNNDEPVTVNGQTVPLGRELAAGLVGTAKPGSAAAGKNFSWVITDSADATSGLASGQYSAVITIPKDFSAAATSTATAADARQARLAVETSTSSKVLDQTISQTIATTAASMLGSQLTASYLDNVFLGFNTLGDKLGEAASGATTLAGSGPALASGAAAEASGLSQLAAGQRQAAAGAQQLSSGSAGLSGGVSAVASGVQKLAAGAAPLASGAQQVASGLSTLNAQAKDLGQLAQLGDGLTAGSQLASGMEQLQSSTYAADCSAGDQTACATLGRLTAETLASFPAGALGRLSSGFADAAGKVSELGALPGAISQLSSGASSVASGTSQLSSGLTQTVSAASQLTGAASQLASGAAQSASGQQAVADALSQTASGAARLSDGVAQFTGGTSQLATGLGAAVASLPSYSDSERSTLAKIVATPVAVKAAAAPGFGELAAPIFGVLALWLGALASFIVLRPVAVTALGSSRSSLVIALRGLVVPALIGAVQGVAVAGALEPMLTLGAAGFLGLAGIGALTGTAFAAVNQALVALFGGTGRFISMIVILLGLATGLVGTVPQFLTVLAGFTPFGPAQRLVAAVVQGTAVPGGAVFGLVLWLLGALAATTLAVARGRALPASRLAPAAASAPAQVPASEPPLPPTQPELV